MTDQKDQPGMNPEGTGRAGRATDDEPENAEGHAISFRKATDDPSMSPDDAARPGKATENLDDPSMSPDDLVRRS